MKFKEYCVITFCYQARTRDSNFKKRRKYVLKFDFILKHDLILTMTVRISGPFIVTFLITEIIYFRRADILWIPTDYLLKIRHISIKRSKCYI